MLSKRAAKFAEHGLDVKRRRVIVTSSTSGAAISDDSIEKQKLFFESMLVKRKVEQLKAQNLSFEEYRERAKKNFQNNRLQGKRNFAELTAQMPVEELR